MKKIFDCAYHRDCGWRNLERDVDPQCIGFHIYEAGAKDLSSPSHNLFAREAIRVIEGTNGTDKIDS